MTGVVHHLKATDFADGTYRVGKVVGALSASYEAKQTEPARRYSQSELLDDMMGAYKFAANDADREVLRQISGLGTSRTRESTITGLMDRGFLQIRKDGRGRSRSVLVPTPAAMTIISHLPDLLTSVVLTAKWELAFRLIEQGKATGADVEKHLEKTLNFIVSAASGGGAIAIEAPAKTMTVANQFARPASARATTGRGSATQNGQPPVSGKC